MASNTGDTIPFQLGKSMYDQGTYKGRLLHFIDRTNPRRLFTSTSQLQASIDLLKKYEEGNLPTDVTDADLWKAQKIKQAIIHPDTEKKILMPFRISGFVPFNTPIVVGLLLPNPTLKATIFWQWLNQSHNAGLNYSNRNATKDTDATKAQFVLGYCGAVTSAISIAVGLNVGLSKTKRFTPQVKSLIQRGIPYPAIACANICNVALMRNNELSTGVDVYDKNGTVIGSSKVAAKSAITSTAVTRVVLPVPVLVLPPMMMAALEKTQFMRSNPRWHLPIQTLAVLGCFAGALPAAIALFPEESKISVKKLEPEIGSRTKEEFLYFNKGI